MRSKFAVIVRNDVFSSKMSKFRSLSVIPRHSEEIQTKTDKYKRILRVFCKNHIVSLGFEENLKYFMNFS